MVDFSSIQRAQGVMDVFVADAVDVELGAEGNRIELFLRALVDQRAEDPVDGGAVDVRLDEC